jgi:RNA polymerase sigma-70 factor (ECF subfamily)
MSGPFQGATIDSPPQSEPASDDSQAVERALNGDLDAYNELVLEYQRLAYSVAYRMLQNQEAAADAVQDSFIKSYRALNTFRGGSFKSWLMRIVVNTCYDVLRARKRHFTDSIDDDEIEQDYAPHLIDDTEGPQAHAERMELSRHIENGIASLPEDQRLVLTLCDVHGYAYEEIAEIAGIPMGTVKSRISRARGRLRDYLLQTPELLPSTLRPRDE